MQSLFPYSGNYIFHDTCKSPCKLNDTIEILCYTHFTLFLWSAILHQYNSFFSKAGICKLSLKYTGNLNDELRGFYRSSYKTTSGEQRYAAVTHFEVSFCFSCFLYLGIINSKVKFFLGIFITDLLDPKSLAFISRMKRSYIMTSIDHYELLGEIRSLAPLMISMHKIYAFSTLKTIVCQLPLSGHLMRLNKH